MKWDGDTSYVAGDCCGFVVGGIRRLEMKKMTDYYPYRAWPSPVVLDRDNKLWDSAVFMLDKELGELGHVCHCEGCGEA